VPNSFVVIFQQSLFSRPRNTICVILWPGVFPSRREYNNSVNLDTVYPNFLGPSPWALPFLAVWRADEPQPPAPPQPTHPGRNMLPRCVARRAPPGGFGGRGTQKTCDRPKAGQEAEGQLMRPKAAWAHRALFKPCKGFHLLRC